MSRHRLNDTDTSNVYTGPDVRELLLFFNSLTLHQDQTAARIQNDVTRARANFLNNKQQNAFHELAETYAGLALAYAQEHPGGRDQSMTGPAMLLIQSAELATHQLADELGIPRHVADHGVWAIARATVAAFTWVKIRHGHIESEKRFQRAVRAVRSLSSPAPQPSVAR